MISSRSLAAVRLKLVVLFCVLTGFLISCGARYTVNVRSDPPGAKVSDLSKGHLGTMIRWSSYPGLENDRFSDSPFPA